MRSNSSIYIYSLGAMIDAAMVVRVSIAIGCVSDDCAGCMQVKFRRDACLSLHPDGEKKEKAKAKVHGGLGRSRSMQLQSKEGNKITIEGRRGRTVLCNCMHAAYPRGQEQRPCPYSVPKEKS